MILLESVYKASQLSGNEKSIITDAEFKEKRFDQRPVYQRILNPTPQ
jgi:hypothetical protein